MNKEYISRINKVFDFIEKNIENSYTLEELAKITKFFKIPFSQDIFCPGWRNSKSVCTKAEAGKSCLFNANQ